MTLLHAPAPPARTPHGPFEVGVVGAGRVGAPLAAALAAAGHRVVAACVRTDASRADALLPGVPLQDPAAVARRVGHPGGLLLLACPDDALPALAAELAPLLLPGALVAHVSGRHGLAALAPLERAGAQVLALHPVLPFTGTSADLDRLAGVRYGVTAPAALLPLADALVHDLGGVPVHVAEELRPLWHAALAHGANHLVALVAGAADLLRAAGATDPGAVLRPLLETALDGALREGDAALTGPVVRGDAGTVQAHLDVLPASDRPAYVALARQATDRALSSGRLAPARAGDLHAVLGGVPA